MCGDQHELHAQQSAKKDRARLRKCKVTTTWYRYGIHDQRRGLLSYQWHPGVEFNISHFHVTGLVPPVRISVEEFIWLLFDGCEAENQENGNRYWPHRTALQGVQHICP